MGHKVGHVEDSSGSQANQCCSQSQWRSREKHDIITTVFKENNLVYLVEKAELLHAPAVGLN